MIFMVSWVSMGFWRRLSPIFFLKINIVNGQKSLAFH